MKPNTQRARIAIILIWIVGSLDLVSILSGFFQYQLLNDARSGMIVTTERASANDLREGIISIAYLIAFTISIITFIMWFRRAYYNLHEKFDYLQHSEGWAAGCWFVPIVSLYRPYQIMKELYTITKEVLTEKGIEVNQNLGRYSLGIWWTLWIINNIIGQVVFRYTPTADSLPELAVATMLSMLNNIIGIPLALITVKVIKDYSKLEPLLENMDEDQGLMHHIVE